MNWTISKYGSLMSNGVAFANPTSTTSEEVQKKMRLAAAAPELLSMLIAIRERATSPRGLTHYDIEEIDFIVAKAKGD